MKKICVFAVLAGVLLVGCGKNREKTPDTATIPGSVKVPALPFSPRNYVCYRTTQEIIIDGDINDSEWNNAPWSQVFTDIEGNLKPVPLHDTRMKMLWDDKNLYIAAELTEPDIQARLKQRDTIIYFDNDFEVFIDPDGDTHGYYEFEINAFNTVWDLLLTTPYRDFGQVLDSWDITGLKSAVKIYGTINNPTDKDEKWTIELAFPFTVLEEFGNMPVSGTQWRINFSRVEWRTKVVNGRYQKEIDPATGKPFPENNWIWSAQGLINMHYPEMWGFLQFDNKQNGDPSVDFVYNPDETIKWELRKLYYAQRNFSATHKRYASDVADLKAYGFTPSGNIPEIIMTMEGYEASLPDASGKGAIIINTLGRIWESDSQKNKATGK